MAVVTYKRLALDWQPAGNSNRNFHRTTAVVLLVIALLAVALSFIPVPENERRERAVVPERIAKFIAQREKPPVVVQPPKPKPEPKPLPKVEPEPKIERKRPAESERKPLTASEKKARETAERSGLLALSSELNDLMDTSEVSTKMAGKLSEQPAGSDVVAGHDATVITAGVAAGGGGVDANRYGGSVGGTQLSAREIASVRSGLFAEEETENESAAQERNAKRSGNGRSEENVTIVFDKHNDSLYTLYERGRRETPGLQGTIVLQITIAPNGDVTDVKILSSELHKIALVAPLVKRIKLFKFEANDVDPDLLTSPV